MTNGIDAALRRVPIEDSPAGPLAGVRVVDLSRLVAGNMLGLQLADFGADVVKVETAGAGDTLREWREAHPEHPGGFDAWWQVYARNKRSLAMNLRDAAAMQVLRSLLERSQVLIESFRPGTLEAMGLAPDVLQAANPRLVIVRVSGWGQSGPYRTLPGFGSLIEGFSGYAVRHGRDGEPPRLPNMALADMIAGLAGAFATLAALRQAEHGDGRGQVVDLSLLEPMLSIMGPDVATYAATGRLPVPDVKIASPRGVYRCRDGRWVSMSGSTDTMARRVFDAIGQGALFDDPRYSTNAARLARDAEIDRMVADFVATLDLDACLAIFREKGVTAGPVNDVAQLLADEHVVARGSYVVAEDGTGGPGVVMHGVTPVLERTPGRLRLRAPRRGEHSAQVLAELGYDRDAIDALVRAGAVECG